MERVERRGVLTTLSARSAARNFRPLVQNASGRLSLGGPTVRTAEPRLRRKSKRHKAQTRFKSYAGFQESSVLFLKQLTRRLSVAVGRALRYLLGALLVSCMFRNRYLSLVLLVSLALGCRTLNGQTVSLSSSQPYGLSQSGDFKLEGTVVNALTGDPVPRALVQLLSPAQHVVMTGPDGRFQFDGLPQGQANFSVQKPGFLVGDGNRGGVVALKSMVTVDAHTQPVTLKMFPQSLLAGHVADSNGEALESTIVRVFRMTVRGGRKIREVVQQKATDEEGNFRIANLPAGRYYVGVQPRATSFTLLDSSKPKLGYPVNIYYPSAPDIASATPIDLAAGATAHLEFSATLERVFDVTGSITGYAQGQGLSVFTLDASGDQTNLGMRTNAQAGTFEMRAVPAGVGGNYHQCHSQCDWRSYSA